MVSAILRKTKPKMVTRRLKRSWLKVKKGHRLYIKETCKYFGYAGKVMLVNKIGCTWRLDNDLLESIWVPFREKYSHKWCSSLFMPRWASRVDLMATEDARLERLKDITEDEAIKEGAVFTDFGKNQYGVQLPGWKLGHPAQSYEQALGTARLAFGNYWNKIIKPGRCWDDNPEVVRLAFRLLAIRD